MPEITTRLPCPVCLGTTMEKVRIGAQRSLEIDHCRRCGGVWLEHGEVQRLRSTGRGQLFEWIEHRPTEFQMRCHDCHAPMTRATAACEACGWTNTLHCPSCDRPMKVEEHAGLRLDVCRHCKGVWFDNHELKSIWGPSFDMALRNRAGTGRAVATAGNVADDVLFSAIFFAPDLMFLGAHAAAGLASAAGNAVSNLPGAVGGAPEVAAGVFEAAGEAAGSVFEAIVGIIAGIFESF